MRSHTRRSHHVSLAAPVWGLLGGLLSMTLIAFWFENHVGTLPSPSQPPLMVVIQQRGGDVTFEVHEALGSLWSTPGAPRAIWTLLVTTRRDQTGETPLWQIETATRWQDPITYGRLPEGFTQMMPGRGAPPALQPDEDYIVSVRGPAGGGQTGFTFQPRGTTRRPVPQHHGADARSDVLTGRALVTSTEQT
jgi:hypothetical protein